MTEERCGWAFNPELKLRECLHAACRQLLVANRRVLYFPDLKRAMCITCGQMYLEIAV